MLGVDTTNLTGFCCWCCSCCCRCCSSCCCCCCSFSSSCCCFFFSFSSDWDCSNCCVCRFPLSLWELDHLDCNNVFSPVILLWFNNVMFIRFCEDGCFFLGGGLTACRLCSPWSRMCLCWVISDRSKRTGALDIPGVKSILLDDISIVPLWKIWTELLFLVDVISIFKLAENNGTIAAIRSVNPFNGTGTVDLPWPPVEMMFP